MNEEQKQEIIREKSKKLMKAFEQAGIDSCFCFGNFTEETVPDATLAATIIKGSKSELIIALAESMKNHKDVDDIVISAFVLSMVGGAPKKSYSLEEILDIAKIKTNA